MTEAQLQASILRWLESNGFFAVKVLVANKSGVPDIIGCTPCGRFFAIEVKVGNNKLSKLQEYKLKSIEACGGLAIAAWSLAEVKIILSKYIKDK